MTIDTSLFIMIILFALSAGMFAGSYAIFIKLHNRFGVSWETTVWDKLTVRKPYKLIVAGTYGQFQDWVHSHIFNFYAPQHLQGRDIDEIEFIKVGDWMGNPMIKELEARMTKEQWQEFLSDPVY